MKRTAVAVALAPAHATTAVDSLRRRLAGSTAREHVVLDFLEDDLREARGALAGVTDFLDQVDAALREEAPSPERLAALAGAIGPAERIDYLQTVLVSVRRRLSQVAARM